jgi:hypothetical protein
MPLLISKHGLCDMTGGKKIIEGLQDAVAHARASNSDLARRDRSARPLGHGGRGSGVVAGEEEDVIKWPVFDIHDSIKGQYGLGQPDDWKSPPPGLIHWMIVEIDRLRLIENAALAVHARGPTSGPSTDELLEDLDIAIEANPRPIERRKT